MLADSVNRATVVWVMGGAPSDEARRELARWAAAHDVTLEEPRADRAGVAVDWSAGDAVEKEIASAREALVGVDLDAAERHLARAQGALRSHPELPNAAWLRAEVERGWSARWLRSNDEDRAMRAWQRAAALDGGRAPGLGERAFAAAPPVHATIEVTEGASLWLDGAPVAPGAVERGAGEHAIAIALGERVVWAAWVSIAAGTVVRLDAPAPEACSPRDVKRARFEGHAIDARAVRCERWVAVESAGAGVLRVATCATGSCGPFVEWRSEPTIKPPPPVTEEKKGWPTWATWVVAGVAVAGTAAAVVGIAAASRTAPTETHFVNGGVQVRAFPF